MIPSTPLLIGEQLARTPGVCHGFTTRSHGNLVGRAGTTNPEAVEHWSAISRRMGFSPGAVAVLSQVHGDRVLPVNAGKGGLSSVGEADAAVCTTPDVLLVVRVADCVPVLLAVPGGVAVAHAGWRGTAAGVVANAVQALCAATGMPTESVVAAIGPHISQAHFQVGEEVVEALRGTGVDLEGLIDRTRAKPHVDLGGVVERQLRAAGVECVDRVGGCSYADLQYFSHRRDGERAGRMAGVIGLRASR